MIVNTKSPEFNRQMELRRLKSKLNARGDRATDPAFLEMLKRKEAEIAPARGQYQRRRRAARDFDVHETRYFYRYMRSGAWKGSRCFIIGGGPSLERFDWSRIATEKVIAVNRSFEKLVTDPAIITSIDTRFWGWLEKGILKASKGYEDKPLVDRFIDNRAFRVWAKDHVSCLMPPDILFLTNIGKNGWGHTLAEGLGAGSNSGYWALNMAAVLGASPIYLLGYDMKGASDGKQKWHHPEYPIVSRDTTYRDYQTYFARAATECRNMGVEVVNLNPDSALTAFPFGSIDDIDPIERPVFVSYFTDRHYQKRADWLRETARPFAIETDIRAVENAGSWSRNMAQKPGFIREMLQTHRDRSVCWVDADAAFFGSPVLLNDLEARGYDVALHRHEWTADKRSNPGVEVMSGVCCFTQTGAARDLVNRWNEEQRRTPQTWDQKTLERALEGWSGSVLWLPPEYNAIWDAMADIVTEPIIEQYQESRYARRRAQRGA